MKTAPRVRPLTGCIGAEVSGIDLKKPPDPDLAEALRRLLWHHQVLFFRGQGLDIAQQKELTQVFGPPQRLPYVEPLPGDPLVVAVLKEASEVKVGVFGGDWHSDFSFLANPPAGSLLNAVEVPAVGGDTVWSNQIAAYEALPPDLKDLVEGRDAIHLGAPYGVKHAPPPETRSGASIRMVRVHPESGHKALFVNPIYTVRLDGFSEAESRPLLARLYLHATRPDFSCRFRWAAGDLAVWDNRTTLHYAVNDYDGSRRLLYRTTFADR